MATQETTMDKVLVTDFVATHRIRVNMDGKERVFTVMCEEQPGPAYTRSEWNSSSQADWECQEDGEWTFQGQRIGGKVTPL
jgi:hypothetical protein